MLHERCTNAARRPSTSENRSTWCIQVSSPSTSRRGSRATVVPIPSLTSSEAFDSGAPPVPQYGETSSAPAIAAIAFSRACVPITETRKRREAGGMGRGELKNLLFEVLNDILGPLRARYDHLMTPSSG
jgi:hypothetical protein